MLVRHTLGQGARGAFTDRYGGVSAPPYAELNLGARGGDDRDAVAANRTRVAGELGLDPANVAWMRQEHGNAVARIRAAPDGQQSPSVDAMVTTVPRLALAVLVADCVPVVLADPAGGVVGVAHAGRSGLARGVVPALVQGALEAGARAERIEVVLGPAICGGCYEVPPEMQQEVTDVTPAAWCRTRRGTAGLDIRAGVEQQLRRGGIRRVRRDPRCTQESLELYSHRREGRTGRSAGYVWLDAARLDG